MSTNGAILPFPPAATSTSIEAATTAYPAYYIIEHILKLSNYLIGLSNNNLLFGKASNDPYTPCLYTLLARLYDKQLAPSRLPDSFQDAEHIQSRIHLRADTEVESRPLADYEDLYYALLARMQEMSRLLQLRIESGFNNASDVICEGGPSLSELHASLNEYWNIFNDPACGKALDDAVREARVHALRDEVIWQVEHHNMSVQEAHEQLAELYSSEVYNNILGLEFIPDWAPTFVGMYLEQKYRPMLDSEKQDAEAKVKTQRLKAKMKATKEASAGAQDVRIGLEKIQTRIMKLSVDDADTKAQGEMNGQLQSMQHDIRSLIETELAKDQHGVQQHEQPSPQRSPEYKAQFHHGEHHEEHSAAIQNEQDTDGYPCLSKVDRMLDWHMKTLLVSEYTDYLRVHASQNAQQAMQGKKGLADIPAGDASAYDEFLHPDMDLSTYMEL